MTPSQQLQEIKEACIAANPEIMELAEGTRVNIWWIDRPQDRSNDPDEINVLVFEDRNGWRDNGIYDGEYRSCIEDNTTGYYKILGRPIRLADIVFVYSKNGWNSTEEWSKALMQLINEYNLLKDDLSLQDPATISFIHSLISKK